MYKECPAPEFQHYMTTNPFDRLDAEENTSKQVISHHRNNIPSARRLHRNSETPALESNSRSEDDNENFPAHSASCG